MLVQRTSLLVLLLVLHSPAQGQKQNETRVDDGHVSRDPSIHFPRGQEDCETDSDCGLTLACIEVNRRFFITQDRSLKFKMSCLENVFRPMSSFGRESLSNGGWHLQGESTFLLLNNPLS